MKNNDWEIILIEKRKSMEQEINTQFLINIEQTEQIKELKEDIDKMRVHCIKREYSAVEDILNKH